MQTEKALYVELINTKHKLQIHGLKLAFTPAKFTIEMGDNTLYSAIYEANGFFMRMLKQKRM
jgi:hypothetical protein